MQGPTASGFPIFLLSWDASDASMCRPRNESPLLKKYSGQIWVEATESSSKGCSTPNRTAPELSNVATLHCLAPEPCCQWTSIEEGSIRFRKGIVSFCSTLPILVISPVSGASHEILPPGRIWLVLKVIFPQESKKALLPCVKYWDHHSYSRWLGTLHQWEPINRAACCKDSFMRIPLWDPQKGKPKLKEENQTGAGGRMSGKTLGEFWTHGIHQKAWPYTISGSLEEKNGTGGNSVSRLVSTESQIILKKQGLYMFSKNMLVTKGQKLRKSRSWKKNLKSQTPPKNLFKDRNFQCSSDYIGTFLKN